MSEKHPLPGMVYLAVVGLPIAGVAWVLSLGCSPTFAAFAGHAGAAVAIVSLERWRPFSRAWLVPKDDLRVDLTHLIVDSLLAEALLRSLTVVVAVSLPTAARVWPAGWPLLGQLVAATVLFEFVQYTAHRMMHHVSWLWPFHAVHHSPERLHLASTFRNHPLDSTLTVALPLVPLALMGARDDLLVLTAVTVGVHSMAQHANIDFAASVVDFVLSTPRLHRWHHSRTPVEADANYGGTLILWDLVFRTRCAPDGRPNDKVGLAPGEPFPMTYIGQLLYPFRSRGSRTRGALARPHDS